MVICWLNFCIYKWVKNNGLFQHHFLKKFLDPRLDYIIYIYISLVGYLVFVTDGSVPTLGAGSASADAYRVVDTARHSGAVQRSRGQIHHPRSGTGTKA